MFTEAGLDEISRRLDGIVEDKPAEGIFRARRDMFTDPELFELEIKHVWEATWIYIGHDSQIPNPNDYLTTVIGRQPVIIARGADGELNGFINACSQQIAQAEGLAFVSGNGANKPTGFLAGPTPVVTGDATRPSGTLQFVPTGSASAITVDSLRAIYFTLKAAHRANASWLMSSATASILSNIKDSEGRSLWHPSLSADSPATLLGRPVFYAEDMPAIAANAFPIAFGDFNAGYLIADSGGLRITIDDNITKPGFVRFYVRRRVGGVIYDSEAIKLLRVSAS